MQPVKKIFKPIQLFKKFENKNLKIKKKISFFKLN